MMDLYSTLTLRSKRALQATALETLDAGIQWAMLHNFVQFCSVLRTILIWRAIQRGTWGHRSHASALCHWGWLSLQILIAGLIIVELWRGVCGMCTWLVHSVKTCMASHVSTDLLDTPDTNALFQMPKGHELLSRSKTCRVTPVLQTLDRCQRRAPLGFTSAG